MALIVSWLSVVELAPDLRPAPPARCRFDIWGARLRSSPTLATALEHWQHRRGAMTPLLLLRIATVFPASTVAAESDEKQK
jgi:uncharacterized membrane protein